MGLKSKSLMALGLKHIRDLIPYRGGYRHRKVRTRNNGELFWLCYTKDLKDQYEVTINNGTLHNMGLKRNENRVVPHKQRIEDHKT